MLTQKAKKVLAEWNPLGHEASSIEDLNEYDTEAKDILFQFSLSGPRCDAPRIVQIVLNQAFGLSLTRHECKVAAREIWQTFVAQSVKQ